MRPPLTLRQIEVLSLLAAGMSNKQIARHLGLSPHAVKRHLERLYCRMDAANRYNAIALGIRRGIIP